MSIEPVPLSLYAEDFGAFAQRLGGSFARYGFAVVTGHDLPLRTTEEALKQTKAFFALPA
ncbi:MAG: 2-oxoglutarate and iron-dependent oxygenase domain-containing protein, partial [Gemmatimonadales bacterium]